MKCADALLMLLDADFKALPGDHASPLGAHLEVCAHCRVVAATLQTDTAQLAAFTAARPAVGAGFTRASRRRRVLWLTPIPVAAALILAYLGSSDAPVIRTPATKSSVQVAHTPEPLVAAPPNRIARGAVKSVSPLITRRHETTGAPSPRVAMTELRATPSRIAVDGPFLAKAVAPSPVTFHPELADVDPTTDVSTPSGRVVVLRPGNANITVVWFY